MSFTKPYHSWTGHVGQLRIGVVSNIEDPEEITHLLGREEAELEKARHVIDKIAAQPLAPNNLPILFEEHANWRGHRRLGHEPKRRQKLDGIEFCNSNHQS